IRHTPPQAAADTTEQAADDGELELFRKAAGKVQPVRGGDRAEIERPRPAPVPRHASVHDEAIEQAHSARAETDPLRLAYQGVMPLRDRGRIELDTPLRHT